MNKCADAADGVPTAVTAWACASYIAEPTICREQGPPPTLPLPGPYCLSAWILTTTRPAKSFTPFIPARAPVYNSAWIIRLNTEYNIIRPQHAGDPLDARYAQPAPTSQDTMSDELRTRCVSKGMLPSVISHRSGPQYLFFWLLDGSKIICLCVAQYIPDPEYF